MSIFDIALSLVGAMCLAGAWLARGWVYQLPARESAKRDRRNKQKTIIAACAAAGVHCYVLLILRLVI